MLEKKNVNIIFSIFYFIQSYNIGAYAELLTLKLQRKGVYILLTGRLNFNCLPEFEVTPLQAGHLRLYINVSN